MEEVELRGAGLVLRPPRPQDTAAVTAACQDPAIQRWTQVPVPYREADARAFVGEHARRQWALGIGAPFLAFEDGVLVASVGLNAILPPDRRAEVGYWVAHGARGRGVAVRAVGVLVAWSFGDLGLERLELYAEVANVASQRVAERSGFTREGLLRGRNLHRGARRDMIAYGRLRTDPTVPAA